MTQENDAEIKKKTFVISLLVLAVLLDHVARAPRKPVRRVDNRDGVDRACDFVDGVSDRLGRFLVG